MKVLFDHQIFLAQKFGGISRYFNELAKTTLYEVDSIDPKLIESYNTQKQNETIVERGIKYIKRRRGLNIPETTGLPRIVSSKIIEGNFDIFHPTYYDTYFLQYINKPFVLTVYDLIHEIYSEYFDLSDLVLKNKKYLCQKAAHIIAISEQTKTDLIQIFGLPESKISVTYLASNFDEIEPSKPAIDISLFNYILFVGNRGFYKNFYFFVQSVANILKSDNSLKLVCTGHELSEDEKNFLNNIGIIDKIVYVYPKNDHELAWLYSNAKVFAFPSLYEGFGFPLLEAFASNCPVISSNGGSLTEVGGNAALYFEPKSMSQIQNAMQTALYDEKVRQSLIHNGQKRFSNFSWDKCRAETHKVYELIS